MTRTGGQEFSPYPNAVLVRGGLPESFANVDIQRVAYLSIDMNIAKPDKLVKEPQFSLTIMIELIAGSSITR